MLHLRSISGCRTALLAVHDQTFALHKNLAPLPEFKVRDFTGVSGYEGKKQSIIKQGVLFVFRMLF